MAATLGELVVQLSANIARFEEAMDKAERRSQITAERVAGYMKGIEKAVEGVALGFVSFKAIDAFAENVEGAIKMQAELYKMAQQTGRTVEELSSLKNVAKLSGTDMSVVNQTLQAVSRSMYETASGTGKARDTFYSLGLNVKDGNGQLKNSATFLVELAKKLDDMSNGTQRAAAAQKTLKGVGAEAMPFLHDLAELGLKEATITTEQAFRAEQYERALISLNSAKKAIYNTVASQVAPVLSALVLTYKDIITQTGGLSDTTKKLAQENTIRQWAVNAGIAIAMVVDGFRYVALGIKIVGDAIVGVGIVFVAAFDVIGKTIGTLSASMADFGLLIQGIGLVMSGRFTEGAQIIGVALDKLKSGWSGFADDIAADMKTAGREFDALGEDIDNMLGSFEQGKTVDMFLDNLQKVTNSTAKLREETGTTNEIVKKFQRDGVDNLIASLKKGNAELTTNLMSMRMYGVETKATTEAEVKAQLAEMARNGTLAEHAKRTGESAKAVAARAIEEAKLKDELLVAIQIEQAYIAAVKKHREEMGQKVQTVVDEIEKQNDLNNTYGLSTAAVTRYTAAKLREKAALLDVMEGATQEAAALRLEADKLEVLASKQDTFLNIKNTADAWIGLADMISKDAALAVTDWGSAVHTLRDQLKQLLADMIAIFAKRWFLNFIAGGTGNGALAAAAAQVGGGTVAGGLLNWISGGSSAYTGYNALTGGTGVAGAIGSTVGSWGNAAYLGYQGGTMVGGTTGMQAANAVGRAVGYAMPYLWIIAGIIKSWDLYNTGWHGDPNQTGVTSGARIQGTPFFSPIGGDAHNLNGILRAIGFSDRNANILSGTTGISRLFGWGNTHPDAAGIMGTITGLGLNAQNYQDMSQRGGLFRSDRRWTDYSALTGDQSEYVNAFMNSVKAIVENLGNMLHVDAAQVLANYTHEFQLQLTNNGQPLSDEEINTLFSGVFGTVLQEQVGALLDAAGKTELAAYIKGLKGTGDEITQQVAEFVGVMQGALASGLHNFTVESVMAMQQTGESLGAAFTRIMTDYQKVVDEFTPDNEKLDMANAQLADLYKGLRDFGYEVPTTRKGWLDVMRSLDMSTEAGRELFARMVALAPAFDAVSSAAEQMMSSFDSLMGQIRPGYTGQMQQLQLTSAIGQFQANNAWSSGLSPDQLIAALLTITRDDFSHYSVENQQLILQILGLNNALTQNTQAAQQVAGAFNGWAEDFAGAQKQGTDYASTIGKVFTGDFKTRMPQYIASLQGAIDAYMAKYNVPGYAGSPQSALDQTTAMAIYAAKIAAQQDLNKFWEFEAIAPGKGEDLLNLQKWYDDSKKLMEGNAAGMLQLEDEFQRRRAEIISGSLSGTLSELEQAKEKLKDSLDSMFLNSQISPLTPIEQMAEARRQYQETLTLAQGGNVDAVNALGSDAQTYLQIARQVLASSPEYIALFRQVATETGGVAGVSAADVNTRLASSLPPSGSTLASSKDMSDIRNELEVLQTQVAQGLTTNDPTVGAKLDTIADILKTLKQQGVLA